MKNIADILIGMFIGGVIIILLLVSYSEGKKDMRVHIEAQCLTLGTFMAGPKHSKFYCVRDQRKPKARPPK